MLIEPETFGITLLLLGLACLGTRPALLRICSTQEDTKSSSFEDAGRTIRLVAQDPVAHSIQGNSCGIFVTCKYLDYSTAYSVCLGSCSWCESPITYLNRVYTLLLLANSSTYGIVVVMLSESSCIY
jgi:hypothetical protein